MALGLGLGLGLTRGKGADPLPILDGVLAWYDASDASTITDTAGAVSRWNDKSGNGHDITDISATTGTRTLNGRNALDFNGSSNYARLPSSLFTTLQNSDITIMVVFAADDIVSQQDLLTGRTTSGTRVGLLYQFNANKLGGLRRDDFSLTEITITPDTDVHIAALRADDGDLGVFYDDQKATGVAGSRIKSSVLDATIGMYPTGSRHFDGAISEVLIFDKGISDADLLANYGVGPSV